MASSDDNQPDTDQFSVNIRLLSIPTMSRLQTARDTAKNISNISNISNTAGSSDWDRKLVVVQLTNQAGDVGWGECSALNEIGYSNESAQTSFDALTADRRPDPKSLPMAAAAMEMARLDLRLRRESRSLSAALGHTETLLVPAGAALGLMPVDQAIHDAARLVGDGYRRIKVKIAPGHIQLVPAALRMTFPDLEIQVDANGSLDEHHVGALIELITLGITAIEQPFATNRPDLAAMLIARQLVPVVADEAAPNLKAVQSLHQQRALTGVSIKPPRVGGLAKALELLAWCVGEGLDATAGGMLESALGRHSLAAFAASNGLTLTGDVSPSRRWLRRDPWPDLTMTNGMIIVPQTPGVAPLPDQEQIEMLTQDQWSGAY